MLNNYILKYKFLFYLTFSRLRSADFIKVAKSANVLALYLINIYKRSGGLAKTPQTKNSKIFSQTTKYLLYTKINI